MPLFGKSHKKNDLPVDTTGHSDPKFSGSGPDPNFTGYGQPGVNNGPGPNPNLTMHNQPGVNNGPGSGFTPAQHPYPNEAGQAGRTVPDSHSKPSRFGGKVESAIGTVIGSDSLRAKGMEKEREARDLNMQSNELAQAESLEREAQMHRDRAMGGGDHTLLGSNDSRRFNR